MYGEFYDVPGFPGYQVNAHGLVRRYRSQYNWKIVRNCMCGDHAPQVNLGKNRVWRKVPVAWLVWLVFQPGEPLAEGEVVVHLDGNRRNIVLRNLGKATLGEAKERGLVYSRFSEGRLGVLEDVRAATSLKI